MKGTKSSSIALALLVFLPMSWAGCTSARRTDAGTVTGSMNDPQLSSVHTKTGIHSDPQFTRSGAQTQTGVMSDPQFRDTSTLTAIMSDPQFSK